MNLPHFPFDIINWDLIEKEEHKGITGTAQWQVLQMDHIRIRKMVYSPGYKADHWCRKGHIIHCINGAMETELEDGRIMQLKKGMTYILGDNCEAHRSSTAEGCELFVVD